MKRLSNRALNRMRHKAMYCKAVSDETQANTIFNNIDIATINKLGIHTNKLKSKSFTTINQVKVNRFNPHYNQGDYYYSDLDCITIRKMPR